MFYANPEFIDGEPSGVLGLVSIAGGVRVAVQAEDGQIWFRMGMTNQWHVVMSETTRKTWRALGARPAAASS